MFRSLVVPLDGSELAERALPYAVQLAKVGRGRIALIQAAHSPTLLVEAGRYLRGIAERLDGSGIPMTITVAEGHAPSEILRTADEVKADAVVMATHGRTGFAHLLYGSVTEALLATSDVPVLVVYARPGTPPQASFSPYDAHVLVPQDGSCSDAGALQAAVNMLGPRGEVTLVTVVPPPSHVLRGDDGRVLSYIDQQLESRQREALRALERTTGVLRERALPIRAHVEVRVGDPASGIALAALDHACDLIVMATRGRTGLRRAVLGSVAGTVMRTIATPVLLVHAQEPAVADELPQTELVSVA
jgi:nucleotide-binding universal stress UspA family protein